MRFILSLFSLDSMDTSNRALKQLFVCKIKCETVTHSIDSIQWTTHTFNISFHLSNIGSFHNSFSLYRHISLSFTLFIGHSIRWNKEYAKMQRSQLNTFQYTYTNKQTIHTYTSFYRLNGGSLMIRKRINRLWLCIHATSLSISLIASLALDHLPSTKWMQFNPIMYWIRTFLQTTIHI